MVTKRNRNPTDLTRQFEQLKDGTLMRQQSSPPGPLRIGGFLLPGETFTEIYAKSRGGSTSKGAWEIFGANFGSKERKLTTAEKEIATRVFQDTIKWSQVRISNGHGRGNSIFTNAGVGQDTLHVTDRYFNNLPSRVLIHELAHVWQATSAGFTGIGYKLNSLIHQAYHIAVGNGRSAAYDYDRKLLGKEKWYSFSIEEQAQIVEDWFVRGELETDPAFRYIHWCIRRTDYLWLYNSVPPDVPHVDLETQKKIRSDR